MQNGILFALQGLTVPDENALVVGVAFTVQVVGKRRSCGVDDLERLPEDLDFLWTLNEASPNRVS